MDEAAGPVPADWLCVLVGGIGLVAHPGRSGGFLITPA